MTEVDQLIDEPRDYSLSSAIELRWHAFSKRRNLRNPHQKPA
jgi:hypothetical protein